MDKLVSAQGEVTTREGKNSDSESENEVKLEQEETERKRRTKNHEIENTSKAHTHTAGERKTKRGREARRQAGWRDRCGGREEQQRRAEAEKGGEGKIWSMSIMDHGQRVTRCGT